MTAPTKQINLMRGWPSPDVLPASILSEACQRILTDPADYTPNLQYGPSAGHERLRDGLAQWLGRHYSVEPDAARICITGGASQNLACILQSFTDPHYTRAVWIVAPCYYLACGIFEDAGFAGRLRATPEDDEGIELEALERSIKELDEHASQQPQQKVSLRAPKNNVKSSASLGNLTMEFASQPLKNPGPTRKLYRHVIYAVPTCSNPSGKTMSLRRREGLVKLARSCNALVVCDDVYDFLQWPLDGEPTPERPPEMRLPRLCDIDLALTRADSDPQGFGYAVSNGSFSKIAGPGMRTGWVEASPAFVTGLGSTASTLSGGAPSHLCAAILGHVVRNGELAKHIEDFVRPSLQRRHRLMMDAVHHHIAPLGIQTRYTSLADKRVYGGYFIWLTPDRGLLPPSRLIAEVALEEENLVIGYGDMFAVHGDEGAATFDRDIRLCFAWESEESLVEGVERLGSVLRRMQDNMAHYEGRLIESPDASFVDTYK